jgi:hypothetical protein
MTHVYTLGASLDQAKPWTVQTPEFAMFWDPELETTWSKAERWSSRRGVSCRLASESNVA